MSDLPGQRTTPNMQFQSALGHPWWFSFYCEGEVYVGSQEWVPEVPGGPFWEAERRGDA